MGQAIRVNINRLTIGDDNLDGKRTLLSWSIRNGYPRVSVYYGKNPEVTGFENMTILPFTPQAILSLIGSIKTVAESSDASKKYTIACINSVFKDNVRTDDKEIVGTITVYRDENGVVALKVKTSKKPEVRFRLLIDKEWYKVYGSNNEEITDKKELSEIYAKTYADVLVNIMSTLITNEAIENKVITDR